ncbi:3-isopropylmalate dehydratase small subunit [Bacillus lacus]|uniref:3-isopropylmalate dehydratase small subunit n=1 Tax=Metabacillus lacus TaxID=1983721 RepID=A0A7X2J2L8_9BACI|nr:3-isopropylmalate dehydratase small subunit [Metabacillus lacus]MRX74216.1 3-isopropylmalate dehydratase small subunit [Metabacillus lacus]
MQAFKKHRGKAVLLDRENVDTDQIIPKQFLKRIEKTGYGRFAFHNWRYLEDGSANPAFELNAPQAKNATILIAGENFGCGSSREHAPWALQDYGFQVVISESFADIFHQNCLKNGLLPVVLGKEEIRGLKSYAKAGKLSFEVDLENQFVQGEQGQKWTFTIDPYWKNMLINGYDEIDITLQYEDSISSYESANGRQASG